MGLLGILEAGRGITAPPSIGGDWTVEFDRASACANGPAALRQPAFNISQSGTEALITLNDGRATTFQATLNGSKLTADALRANIVGKAGERQLTGTLNIANCGAIAFRAVRQVSRKSGA
jgi:hypothetical protein